MTLNCVILPCCLCVLLSLRGTCLESLAERMSAQAHEDGTVVTQLWYITQDKFSERLFKEVSATVASRYCKQSEGNCETEDKQIRPNDVIVIATVPDQADEHLQVHVYIRDRFDENEAALRDNQLANAYREYKGDFQDGFGNPITVIRPEEEHWEAWRIAVVAVCACVGALALIGAALVVRTATKTNEKSMSPPGTGSHTPDEVSRHLSLYESVKGGQENNANVYDNLAYTSTYENTASPLPQNGNVVYDNVSDNKTVNEVKDQPTSVYVGPETTPRRLPANPDRDVNEEQTTSHVAGVYIDIIPDEDQQSSDKRHDDSGDAEAEYEDITAL